MYPHKFWRRYFALCALFLGILLIGRIHYVLTVDISQVLTLPMLVALVTVAAWVVFWLSTLVLVRMSLARTPSLWRWLRFPSACLLFALILMLAVSWVFFLETGTFLTRNTLEFFFRNAGMVIDEMRTTDLLSLALAFVAAVILTGLLVRLSYPGRTDATPSMSGIRIALFRTAIAAMGISLVGGLLFPVAALDPVRAGKYSRQLKFRSAPGLALTASLLSTPVRHGYPANVTLQPRNSIDRWLEDAFGLDQWPNIVLVIVESLRRDSLRKTGSDVSVMPFLDALAEESLLFGNAYAQGSATHYTVPAILSSLYPLKLPFDNNTLGKRAFPRTLLWDLLKPLGYRTGYFSSQNERWAYLSSYLQTPGLDRYFHARDYQGQTLLSPLDQGMWNLYERGVLKSGYLDDADTVDAFASWLESSPAADRNHPFLAVLNLQATHFPYEMARQMDTPFRPNEIEFESSYLWYPAAGRQVMLNRFRNSLRYVDGRLKDIYRLIGRYGDLEKTLFVVVGDHGEAFHEQGLVTHGRSLHEAAVSVPLLIHAPAKLGRKGQLSDLPVQQIDIIPTLLGLMGLPPHPSQQGADVLAPYRLAKEAKLFLCVQQIGEEYALIWNGYKYVLNPQQGSRLYSLRDDAGEQDNLVDREPALAALYEVTLQGWINTQLGYYADPGQIAHYYPPRY